MLPWRMVSTRPGRRPWYQLGRPRRGSGPLAVVSAGRRRHAGSQEVGAMTENEAPTADPRARAIVRLKKKAEFRTHLFVYLVVNAVIVAIWALTGAHSFWPMFPILIWGIGLIFH